LSILNDSKVKYLIVGGYAVSFHAQPRATKDLDILTGCPECRRGLYGPDKIWRAARGTES
jgi:hypothetical protein